MLLYLHKGVARFVSDSRVSCFFIVAVDVNVSAFVANKPYNYVDILRDAIVQEK